MSETQAIAAELALALTVQVGVIACFLGGMRSDLKNALGWLSKLQKDQKDTRDRVMTLEGRMTPYDASPPTRSHRA